MTGPSHAEPTRQRVDGVGELGVAAGPPRRALRHLYQQGAARIRLPNSRFDACEAVLINTAGGLTGDDRLHWSIDAEAGAHTQLSTSAAEKVYRTHGPTARVSVELQVGAAATLEWLPQETILFEGSALQRTLEVRLAASASVLMVESIVLGRREMGEALRSARLTDHWRIHRDGRLLHAEALRLNDRVLADPEAAGTLDGRTAFATVLYCGPETAERLRQRAEAIRHLWGNLPDEAHPVAGGVSVLPSRLVVRIAARDGRSLRSRLITALASLSRSQNLPRVWEV